MVAFISILAISMKINIDTQIRLYTELVQKNYNYELKFDEIRKELPFTYINSQSEFDEKISDEVTSKSFKDKLKSLANGTMNFMFFATADHWIDRLKIHSYSFGSDLEDNYISFSGTEESEEVYYSLDRLNNSEKSSLLEVLRLNINNGDIAVEYCVQNNQLSYIKYADFEYGKKTGETKSALPWGYSILGNHIYYDVLQSQFNDFNIEEMKEVVRNHVSSFNGDDGFVRFPLTYKDKLYSIMTMSYYKAFSVPDDANTFNTIVIVNVVNDLEGYVIQTYLQENIGLYLGAFIIAILTSWILSYMIAKPIRKIEKAALRISNQEFDIEINIKSNDEIGSLAQSIDSMRIQLKETIESLLKEIEKVKELESLRKDFVNQFTHEIKTPLGIINGYSELIEETENQKELDKYLDIINRETNRINELIQSMLKLSRLEAGKVEVNKEDFDLEEVVVHIIDEYEVLLMKKSIKVEVQNINSSLYADKKLIKSVIRNFLSNAIKHTRDGHRITITINQGVSIYNEGDLIPEEKLEYIWYMFVTHEKKGSGLGLSICRSIFELHNFEYGVKNGIEGVCFYFIDPAK